MRSLVSHSKPNSSGKRLTRYAQIRAEYETAAAAAAEKHERELSDLETRLRDEREAWERQYQSKQEAWLASRERELKGRVREERDREIELVISQLESDLDRQRSESEKSGEARVRRLREKYESELSELEKSEQTTRENLRDCRTRLVEVEGLHERCKLELQQREQDVSTLEEARERWQSEKNRVADVVRQEFAEKLVSVDEENRRLKVELAEVRERQRAETERHRGEMDKLARQKEEEIAQIHERVKAAIVKKEEVVGSLRQQFDAAQKRAEHLEGLLEKQRAQLGKTKQK